MDEVDVVLIDHTPDVVQPISQATDRFAEKLLLVRTVLNKRALSVPLQLVEQTVDFHPLRFEVESWKTIMSSVKLRGMRKRLFKPDFFDLVQQGDKVFFYQLLLSISR